MASQLRHLLKSITAFDEDELDQVCSCFKPRSIRKNTILLSEGDTCKEFYYVEKGCLRTYFITRQGHEKTRYVMLDCSIGTALTSFISQKPSIEYIDALEDTEVLAISHQDFYLLNDHLMHWKAFYQKILEMAYSFQNKSFENLVTLTARQRFEQVMDSNPKLVQRLSNKVLASYLDITQETLSRLKSR